MKQLSILRQEALIYCNKATYQFSKVIVNKATLGSGDLGQLFLVHMVESHQSMMGNTSLNHKVIPICFIMIRPISSSNETGTMLFV